MLFQGSLATESAVLKLSGKVFDKPFQGPVSAALLVLTTTYPKYFPHPTENHFIQAIVFDSELSAYDAVMSGEVKPGHVLVIRYEGPKGRSASEELILPMGLVMLAKITTEICKSMPPPCSITCTMS